MIVLIVHDLGIRAIEAKGDAPVSTDIYSPRGGSISFQLVKPKAGKPHVLRPPRSMEPTKYETESFRMGPLDSGNISGLEEEPEAPMLETQNHSYSVTRVVTGVNNPVATTLSKRRAKYDPDRAIAGH